MTLPPPKSEGKVGDLYWHVHHEVLLEPLTEPVKNRIAYIRQNKPASEIETRLRLMKPVRGKVIIPAAVRKAYADWQKADADWQKAVADWEKAVADWEKADADWQKAVADWEKADADWRKAVADRQKADADWRKAVADRQKADADWEKAVADRQKAVADRQKAYADWRKSPAWKKVEALHAKECPGCPWNGSTIFPESKP